MATEQSLLEYFNQERMASLSLTVKRTVSIDIAQKPRERLLLVPAGSEPPTLSQVLPFATKIPLRNLLAQQNAKDGGIWLVWCDVPVDPADSIDLRVDPFSAAPVTSLPIEKILSGITSDAMSPSKGPAGGAWVASTVIRLSHALADDHAGALTALQSSAVPTLLWTEGPGWSEELLNGMLALNDGDVLRCMQKAFNSLPPDQRSHAADRLESGLDVSGPILKAVLMVWWKTLASDSDVGIRQHAGMVLARMAKEQSP
ncbi:MAG: hypothetical protein H0W83_03465 [Planctomycetes bacterium]|nr:hypothetical protein [Planctomycetota bacterium]